MEEQTGHRESSREGPTNSDIIALLGKMDQKLTDMDNRLNGMDKQLQTLHGLEKKVENFDKDLKKLWIHIDNMNKDTTEKITRVENKVDSAEIDIEGARRKIADLERDNGRLKEDMNYIRSQSMRNNLIFGNIPEEPNETPVKSEQIVREFMVNKLKVARDVVDSMKFERVHRMGQRADERQAEGTNRAANIKTRSIVCKFSFFRDREMVRGQSKNLKGTNFYVSEQFPPEIAAKRKRLFRRAKAEKDAGRKAWVSYDTLYVDGKAVKDA